MTKKIELQTVSLDEMEAVSGGWLFGASSSVSTYDYDYDYTYAGYQSHNTGGTTSFIGNGNTVVGNGSNNGDFSSQ